MKGIMKGLGLELIIGIIVIIFAALLWAVLDYGKDLAFGVLIATSTDAITITRITQMSNVFYASLFILALITMAWVWKTSMGRGALQ